MIQEAIFARLSAVAGLTTLVPASRMYYRLMQENTAYPALRYFEVHAEREHAMGVEPGIAHALFQFDVFDLDPDSVRDVTEQLRLALTRWRGSNLSGVAQIFDTFVERVHEVPEPELVDAVPVYRGILEALIHHTEA